MNEERSRALVRRCLAVFIVTASAVAIAAEPTVRVSRAGDAAAWIAETDDEVIATAFPRAKDGRRRILILATPPREKPAKDSKPAPDPCDPDAPQSATATEEAGRAKRKPRRILLFDPSGEGTFRPVRSDLPGDVSDLLAADLDCDGVDELLLAQEEQVAVLRDDGDGSWSAAPRPLRGIPAGAGFHPGLLAASAGGDPILWIPAVGSLRGYGPIADSDAWGPRHLFSLPFEVEQDEAALVFRSPVVVAVRDRAVAPFLATAPENEKGTDRIRTVLVRPGPQGAFEGIECWCRLPGRERILEGEFVVLDGTPALAVLTMSADRLSLFGEKLIRLCPLEPDRTRAGKPPILAVESRINLWQEAKPLAVDANGDGRSDLVLAYWKGLADDTVVLDAYLRRPDGSFDRAPRTTSFDVEDADRGFLEYGRDLDGDGHADLLVIGAGRLLLHPGVPSGDGKRIVDGKPRWGAAVSSTEAGADTTIEVAIGTAGVTASTRGGSGGRPRFVDLDGDETPEILVGPTSVKGRSVLILARLRS